jgi:hypothetical protein
MGQSVSGAEAAVILLACTAAILLFTYVWAASNLRPVRRRAVSGRPAAPYWHTPSGIQDERGIIAVEPRPEQAS